jgi:hypothetical protein
MKTGKKYMAAWVPRYLRQTKLAYLPAESVICTQTVRNDGGQNIYTDLIMLPVKDFKRMQGYIGLQLAAAPTPVGSFDPVFAVKGAKQVVVPENQPNPEAYARAYFLIEFGIVTPDKIALENDGLG